MGRHQPKTAPLHWTSVICWDIHIDRDICFHRLSPANAVSDCFEMQGQPQASICVCCEESIMPVQVVRCAYCWCNSRGIIMSTCICNGHGNVPQSLASSSQAA